MTIEAYENLVEKFSIAENVHRSWKHYGKKVNELINDFANVVRNVPEKINHRVSGWLVRVAAYFEKSLEVVNRCILHIFEGGLILRPPF